MPERPEGNRNLAQLSSSSWSKAYTGFDGGINKTPGLGKVLTDGMQVGDTFRARIVLKYDNIVPAEGKTAKAWMQGSGNVTGWNAGGFPNTSGQKVLSGSGEIVFESVETIRAEHLQNTYWNWAFRLDYVASGSIQWKEGKVEIGQDFTPYTPAPEQLGWSATPLVPTQEQRYLWKFEYVYYSDGSVEVNGPTNLSIAGADADTTGVTAAIEQTNQTVANLQNSVSQAQSDLATVSSNLTQARQDLESSIASVDIKAQAIETTLTQVQSTANANSQKTATLENDLDGLSAKFSSLKVGAVNLLKNSKTFKGSNITGSGTLLNETYQGCAIRYLKTTGEVAISEFRNCIYPVLGGEYVASFWAKGGGILRIFFYGENGYLQVDSGLTSEGDAVTRADGLFEFNLTEDWQRYWIKYKLRTAPASATSVGKHLLFRTSNTGSENEIYLAGVQLEEGSIATDYSPNEADIELKVADYKQTAEQNYASLQSTVQALDGTVTANKATADQTAAGFSTRIESLETYKDGETTRANQYFESAKTETARQLTAERTAIANDYVAKSTYTSDVTGIRNDLTATATTANTTKTNLANYQASNDQAVASLQSSLQTTDGNVSSLQTQINAVPGQITSAVSAVEGKIPTKIGAVNLLKNTKSFKGSNITGSGTLLTETYQGCAIRHLKTTGEVTIAEFGNCVYPTLGGEYVASFWAKGSGTHRIFFYGNNNYLQVDSGVTSWGDNTTRADGLFEFDVTDNWQRYWIKYKLKTTPASAANVGKHLLFRTIPGGSENEIYLAGVQLENGNVVSDYAPNSEDTAQDISKLSSELTQTKDGMTLLATKTELNTAKSDLQSGITTATSKADSAQSTANGNAQIISTHTTQISALNTGLQSKVSQSDFDSLSGDVDDLSSELTQTASSITASVSSVQTAASNAQATANTAVSKADAAQAGVNTLDSTTVKSASLNLDNNGFVTKVGKTIDGNKFATMIAQDANNVKIIADEMQVTANMIVDGAVTAEKLDVNNLSAVTANLGDMTSGSITNTFTSGTRSGSVKIGNGVEITTVDTSGYLPEKAKTYSHFSDDALSFSSSTSNDEPTHSMMIMPEMISYTKHNYDTSSGGTGGWTLRHNGHYSMLEVDMVWQNVRLSNTSELPYGVRADYVRIGNLVTVSVNRQITSIAAVTENQLANETIPEGFRPISQAHLTLTGNTGSTIDATCIVHLNPDGTIRFTNNKSGNRVWTGTVTYTCVEAMPYSTSNNNISTI